MAKITMQMFVDGKLKIDQNLRKLPADSVAPYAEQMGFSKNDFLYTATQMDRDSTKAAALKRAMADVIDDDKTLGYEFKKTILTQDLELEGLDSGSIVRLVRELDSNAVRFN